MEDQAVVLAIRQRALADMLAMVVSFNEVRPIVVADAVEAFAALHANAVSALVIDHHLGGLKGSHFVRLLKSSPRWKDLQTILLLDAEEEREALEKIEVGADCYLVKPFDVKDLLTALGRASPVSPPAHRLPNGNNPAVGLLEETQQFIEQTQRQIRTFGEFSERLAAAETATRLAEITLDHVAFTTGAERGFFFLISDDLTELRPAAAKEFSKRLLRSLQVPIEENGLLSACILQPEIAASYPMACKPETIFEVVGHPGSEGVAVPVDLVRDWTCTAPDQCGTAACCALQFVPARTRVHVGFPRAVDAGVTRTGVRKAFGVIFLDNPVSRRPFHQAQIAGLQPLLRQAAFVLEDIYLAESFRKRLTEVSILQQTSELVSSSLDLQHTLDSIVKAVTDGLQTRRGSLMLIEDDGDLYIRAYAGMSPEAAKAARVRPGEGLAGWAFQNRKPLLIRDVESDPLFRRLSNPEYLTRSTIIAPLEVDNEVIGVINVSDRLDGSSFDERDLNLLQAIAHHASIALKNAKLYYELRQSYFETVKALSEAIEAKDPYTRGHSERVALYTTLVAEEMGMDSKLIALLKIAGILHDVGKIGVREGVLLKPDRLTDDEFNEMKRHALQGDTITAPIKFIEPVRGAIRSHHEWYAGGGYPDGLRGDDIPLVARMMAVADSYDAMTTDRKYRKALLPEEAVKRLNDGKGTQFDPEVVDAFMKVLQSGKATDSLSSVNK
ncbi:MAG: HD domain-containing phosphohydrolase [bacterium]